MTALTDRWKVGDEGDLTDLLGVEFTRDGKSICLSQIAYIEKLVADFPEGVPTEMQANRTPCDSDMSLHVAVAFSITDELSTSCSRSDIRACAGP